MNQELWQKIEAFDLDAPSGEYGFSIRLAKENYWTKNFTTKAITEYKKFMYLAATSDQMVSPSPIIDAVWHQHLIFTQSYQAFCDKIGKQIQHVPSTHNPSEFEKFKQAKERTAKLYESEFGHQPQSIWGFHDMYESLNLEKSNLKIRAFLVMGILAVIFLTIPFYYALKPVYVNIDNPDFLIGLIGLIIAVAISLELFNVKKQKEITSRFNRDSFVFNLSPVELIYLKTQRLPDAINSILNEFIVNKTIVINHDNSIHLVKNKPVKETEHAQIINYLNDFEKVPYPYLMKVLTSKAIFRNIENCMDAFKKYCNKSKAFAKIFYINFGVLSFMLLLTFTRFATGVSRNRPILFIGLLTVFLIVFMVYFLNRLTKQISVKTIPELYHEEILTKKDIQENWQWQYFLLGYTVLTPSFVPLVDDYKKNHPDGYSGGTSCGSGCGSSCGGGGCGGGCGGCGGS
ncbi:glycine-rich domain-containing protein [Flavobacterium terrisoli]|uniref:glycine-rich domain-containing protein n=1 Tax=Flavobacterium terrisoli TaxID=3242195 RepID=UPI00254382D3|nr:hypothetical protein [Flavobacterium buctense]